MRSILTALAILILPAALYAQTVVPNTAFSVQLDHTGDVPTGYVLILDGVRTTAPASARVGTVVTIPVAAGVPAGKHTVQVAAVYPAPTGELASTVLTFQAVVPPNPTAPTNPRILVNGTVVKAGVRVPATFELAANVNRRTGATTLRLVQVTELNEAQ